MRPMTSLRHPTWRFWPFRSQAASTCLPQTSDSSVIENNWPRNDQKTDQESGHKYDHNFSQIDSTESRRSEIDFSKIDLFDVSDFRVNLCV